ncbi:hypothetical protein Amn_pb00320 (plasmid) [Aminobacter sp. Y103A]|uniref:hypothetical protein n=1 Tax=Aminobacter sp. Y103A TaxID=1870862 RepID=UPI002573CB7C|nr:hypothetical protein [Aminobacter sp. SS-2016]BBD41041.1 hypothetical protein Amn_pb00320 [Aminobacter sp. SS-2016]
MARVAVAALSQRSHWAAAGQVRLAETERQPEHACEGCGRYPLSDTAKEFFPKQSIAEKRRALERAKL